MPSKFKTGPAVLLPLDDDITPTTLSLDATGRYCAHQSTKGVVLHGVPSIPSDASDTTTTATSQLLKRFYSEDDVAAVRWNPHFTSREIIASASRTSISLWDAEHTSHPLKNHLLLPPSAAPPTNRRRSTTAYPDLAWSPFQPSVLGWCSAEHTSILLYDIRTAQHPFPLTSSSSGGAHLLRWSVEDPFVVASAHRGMLRLWDTRKGVIAQIACHKSSISGAEWRPGNGSQMATCSPHDLHVKFWRWSAPSECQYSLQTHLPVQQISFTPFGRGLATMSKAHQGSSQGTGQSSTSDSGLRLWTVGNAVGRADKAEGVTGQEEEEEVIPVGDFLASTAIGTIAWRYDAASASPFYSPFEVLGESVATTEKEGTKEGATTTINSNRQSTMSIWRVSNKLLLHCGGSASGRGEEEDQDQSQDKLGPQQGSEAPAAAERPERPAERKVVRRAAGIPGMPVGNNRQIEQKRRRQTQPEEGQAGATGQSGSSALMESEILDAQRTISDIVFTKVNLRARVCEVSIMSTPQKTPAGVAEPDRCPQLRIGVCFPEVYPLNIVPSFVVISEQKTSDLSTPNQQNIESRLISHLVQIASSQVEQGKPCLRNCLLFLKESLIHDSQLKELLEDGPRVWPQHSIFSPRNELSSKPEPSTADSRRDPARRKSSTSSTRPGSIRKNDNTMMCPRLCGACWGIDGQLVYFSNFPTLKPKRKTKPHASDSESDEDKPNSTLELPRTYAELKSVWFLEQVLEAVAPLSENNEADGEGGDSLQPNQQSIVSPSALSLLSPTSAALPSASSSAAEALSARIGASPRDGKDEEDEGDDGISYLDSNLRNLGFPILLRNTSLGMVQFPGDMPGNNLPRSRVSSAAQLPQTSDAPAAGSEGAKLLVDPFASRALPIEELNEEEEESDVQKEKLEDLSFPDIFLAGDRDIDRDPDNPDRLSARDQDRDSTQGAVEEEEADDFFSTFFHSALDIQQPGFSGSSVSSLAPGAPPSSKHTPVSMGDIRKIIEANKELPSQKNAPLPSQPNSGRAMSEADGPSNAPELTSLPISEPSHPKTHKESRRKERTARSVELVRKPSTKSRGMGEGGADALAVLTSRIIVVADFALLMPVHRDLALAYQLGDETNLSSLCLKNSRHASSITLKEVEGAWLLSSLVTDTTVPDSVPCGEVQIPEVNLLPPAPVPQKPPPTPASASGPAGGNSLRGRGVKPPVGHPHLPLPSPTSKLSSFGSVKAEALLENGSTQPSTLSLLDPWEHHPLGGRLAEMLLDYFAAEGDFQTRAVLGCVFLLYRQHLLSLQPPPTASPINQENKSEPTTTRSNQRVNSPQPRVSVDTHQSSPVEPEPTTKKKTSIVDMLKGGSGLGPRRMSSGGALSGNGSSSAAALGGAASSSGGLLSSPAIGTATLSSSFNAPSSGSPGSPRLSASMELDRDSTSNILDELANEGSFTKKRASRQWGRSVFPPPLQPQITAPTQSKTAPNPLAQPPFPPRSLSEAVILKERKSADKLSNVKDDDNRPLPLTHIDFTNSADSSIAFDSQVGDMYKLMYAEYLFLVNALTERARVMKLLTTRTISNDASHDPQAFRISLESVCARCGRAGTTTTGTTLDARPSFSFPGPQAQPPRSNYCTSCNRYGFVCVVCQVAVLGLSSLCLKCGHGGHPAHMEAWFQASPTCPTGCGCACPTQQSFKP